MALGILPVLASQAQQSQQTGRTVSASSRGAAVASARVVKPFTMTPMAQAATGAHDYGIVVFRRTSIRDCPALLGTDATPGRAALCELRLIELQ